MTGEIVLTLFVCGIFFALILAICASYIIEAITDGAETIAKAIKEKK